MRIEFTKVIVVEVVVHVVECTGTVRFGRSRPAPGLFDCATVRGDVGIHDAIAVVLGVGRALQESEEELRTLFVDGAGFAFANVGHGRGRGACGGGVGRDVGR